MFIRDCESAFSERGMFFSGELQSFDGGSVTRFIKGAGTLFVLLVVSISILQAQHRLAFYLTF